MVMNQLFLTMNDLKHIRSFPTMGLLQTMGFSPAKWLKFGYIYIYIHGGTSISGNLHIYIYIYRYID